VNLFTVLNPTLEKQIASAARSVEDARRNAHRDVSRLGELVDHISVLADLRQQEGDFRKAESLYREALFRIQDTKKPDPELTVGVYSLLAYLYDRWGKHNEAAEFYQKALKLGDDLGVQDPDKIATVKNNLAMIHKNMRQNEKAVQCYEDALDGFRKAHGEQSSKVASVYNNLGVLHYQNMEVERALEMHLKALSIRENLRGPDAAPGDLSQTYINLAAVYKALGDFQMAHECVEKARQISSGVHSEAGPTRRRSAALQTDQSE
jgi:tetratricopeptide (TPR) repeat protein